MRSEWFHLLLGATSALSSLVCATSLARAEDVLGQPAQTEPASRPTGGALVGVVPEGFALRMAGVRAGPLRPEDTRDVSGFIAAQEYSDALVRIGMWSARYTDHAWVGYDGRDLTYDFALSGALGVFLPFGEHHGPILRISARAEALQLVGLNLTQVALPGAELGYSYLDGPTQLEIAATVAPSLVGEFRRGEDRIALEGPLFGGLMTVRWQALSLTVDTSFTDLSQGPTLMRTAAHLCGVLTGGRGKRVEASSWVAHTAQEARKFRLSICTDFSGAELLNNPVPGVPLSFASLGLSLLVGNVSYLYTPSKGVL
ncbi:MAG: hypothetical protein B6A08_01165 [Sorangiineae bacterium NIC37A_2]|nr:MAG: hypothetical protein B6A08_01165 [Sorangiineae bacterium NIC37A_2]